MGSHRTTCEGANVYVCVCTCACARARACVCACVRVCAVLVSVSVRACVRVRVNNTKKLPQQHHPTARPSIVDVCQLSERDLEGHLGRPEVSENIFGAPSGATCQRGLHSDCVR